jgi:hypothetical protein
MITKWVYRQTRDVTTKCDKNPDFVTSLCGKSDEKPYKMGL